MSWGYYSRICEKIMSIERHLVEEFVYGSFEKVRRESNGGCDKYNHEKE
jgi:hypothetical protein